MALATTGPSSDPLSSKDKSGTRRSLELLGNLTLREIRSQYKRTALGRLWSFVNPLATIGIYSLVFGFILVGNKPEPGLNSGVHVFALWLATALIPWNFISGAVMGGMNSLLGNAGLLSKVYFPRWILVISQNLSVVFTFLTELAIVVAVMVIAGGPRVLLYLPLVLVLVALTAAFTAGLALMLSVVLIYFRDTQHFMALAMQVWMYLTPIIYPMTLVTNKQASLAKEGTNLPLDTLWQLNPAYHFIHAYRSMLYDFAMPPWQDWVYIVGWTAVALGVGSLVFRKFSSRIVEEL